MASNAKWMQFSEINLENKAKTGLYATNIVDN